MTYNAAAKQNMRDAWMKLHRSPNSCDDTFTGGRSRRKTPYDSISLEITHYSQLKKLVNNTDNS